MIRRASPWPRSAAACVLVLLVSSIAACGPPEPPPRPRGDGPSLILLLTVDQMRADYLERFRPVLDGGLARLLDEGAVFTRARHAHAETATAPGHATIASGRHPASSGIVGNYWFDREHRKRVYSAQPLRADGTEGPVSPGHLQVDTLGDWIKSRDPRGKVFTASGKDRAAAMMGGRSADGVFWYGQETGEWVTSSHYAAEPPAWLRAFNERRLLGRYFGELWEPLPLDPAVAAELGVEPLYLDRLAPGFPHPVGEMTLEPSEEFYEAVYDSPFVDAYLVDLALEILEAEQLGQDGSLDLLGLSFSAVDTVGHDYGPDSPEVLDTILRLDRGLGVLLDRVDELVGAEHVVVALSADHGVAPVPEVRESRGLPGTRLGAAAVGCFQAAGRAFEARRGDDDWFLWPGYLNRETVRRHGLSVDEVAAELAAELQACPGVERVWTAADLRERPAVPDPHWRAFRNSWYPERSPDLTVQFAEYAVSVFDNTTTHGSAYDYDARVPMILVGPGVRPGTVEETVYTVDIAPSLATLTGVPVPDDVDGVDRSGLVSPGW